MPTTNGNRQPDNEVQALARAYRAITSQPRSAWPRMMEWLNGRITADEAGADVVKTSDASA